MNKFTLPMTGLLLALASQGAFAATTGTTTGTVSAATSGVSAGGNTKSGVDGNLSDQSGFADVMASLSASSDTYASIDWTKINAKHVKLVHVSKLNGYASSGLKLDDASKANMSGLDAKVAANADLTATLKKDGVAPSDVVAVSSNADGELVVFIAS